MNFELLVKALNLRGYELEFSSNNYEVNVILFKNGLPFKSGVGLSTEEAMADLIIDKFSSSRSDFPGLSQL